jgi:ribonucleoside-diphosphate reductase alpha chain
VLEEYLQQRAERTEPSLSPAAPLEQPLPALYDVAGQKIGDLCPECGQASVVNEEGCRKCYSCGFSEC